MQILQSSIQDSWFTAATGFAAVPSAHTGATREDGWVNMKPAAAIPIRPLHRQRAATR